MSDQIQFLNPDGLAKNPAFSQVVTTQGPGKTIYVGGQNAVNAAGEVVGKGYLATQTEEAIQNVQTALSACNATFENVIQLSIYVVDSQKNNLYGAFQASQRYFEGLPDRPAISVLVVSGLANPDYLVEITAVAFVAEQQGGR